MAQDSGDVSVDLSNDKENSIVTTSDNEPTGDVSVSHRKHMQSEICR